MKRFSKSNIFICLILLIQLVMFYCYIYGDVLITTMHGMSFWDCLFSGQIRDYYKINLESELIAGCYSGNYAAGYDFFVYIIFAIWDFPLWICRRVFGIANPLNYLLGNMWAKSIVLVFYVLTLLVMKKIMDKLSLKSSKLLVVLMTTSIFISTYLGIIGQYDIITVFFMLLGIYYLISDRFLIFILLFSIAIPTKVFALLAFIPILLLYEKKIIKIIGYFVLSMIPMLLFRLLIPMVAGKSNIDSFFGYLFFDYIPLGTYRVSLFVMFYIALLLFCFLKKRSEDTIMFTKEIVYIAFLSYVIFFAFAYTFPYWMVYMLPYLYLMLCINKEFYVINLLLETCMSFFAVLGQSITFYWVFSSTILRNALLGNNSRLQDNMNYTIVDCLKSLLGENYYNTAQDYILQVCWAVFIVAVVFFIILNCPWRKPKQPLSELNCKENRILLYAVRAICLVIVYAIPFSWVFII